MMFFIGSGIAIPDILSSQRNHLFITSVKYLSGYLLNNFTLFQEKVKSNAIYLDNYPRRPTMKTKQTTAQKHLAQTQKTGLTTHYPTRMAFRDLQSMIARLMQFARSYENEVVGYYSISLKKIELFATLGERNYALPPNMKRTFHTHPRGHAQFSDADILSFLVNPRQAETLIASPKQTIIARKRDPRALYGIGDIIREVNSIVFQRDWSDTCRILNFQSAGSDKIPAKPCGGKVTNIFQVIVLKILSQMLGLRYIPLLRDPTIFVVLGIDSERYSSSSKVELFRSDPDFKLIKREIDDFYRDPEAWLRKQTAKIDMTIYF